MLINIRDVPFSRAGSYMALSILPPDWGHSGIALRSMRAPGGRREILHLEPVRGAASVSFSVTCTPAELVLREPQGGTISICYAAPDVLRLRGDALALRLRTPAGMPTTVYPSGESRWQAILDRIETLIEWQRLAGQVEVDAVYHVRKQDRDNPNPPPAGAWCTVQCGDDGAPWELLIHECVGAPRLCDTAGGHGEARRRARQAWDAFRKTTPAVPPDLAKTAALAMFVNYTSLIAPDSDAVKRRTMLMSKNWMCRCWSWDHCINAIAHAETDPDLAWDLYQGPFDHQDADGCLPDCYSGSGVSRSFTKPPIHGWTLGCLRRRNPALLTPPRAAIALEQLKAWTTWWQQTRDTDGDGLPEYRHGNDSGWDNATVFDVGIPLVSPDLPAYLVLQMDEMAALADSLGDSETAAHWRSEADAMLGRLLERLWTGEQFLARQAFTGARPPRGDCLLNHIPILLGLRLPVAQRNALVEKLQPDGPFVTDNGPATESPRSPLYVGNGYWRGPIWGPATVMVVDGLHRAGACEQAREVAQRYCRMCAADGCLAENYNAETGRGLRDRAYTWGASAFLICARLLQEN